jgi:hypothetical protein
VLDPHHGYGTLKPGKILRLFVPLRCSVAALHTTIGNLIHHSDDLILAFVLPFYSHRSFFPSFLSISVFLNPWAVPLKKEFPSHSTDTSPAISRTEFSLQQRISIPFQSRNFDP